MDWHAINVWTHVLAGVTALGLGLAPLATTKGGDLHRTAGKLFVPAAAVTIITAIIGDVFFDPPIPLVAATVAAAYQYVSSLRALALKTEGPGWFDFLIALGGLGGCAALYWYMGPGTAAWTPAIGYSTIGYIAALVLYDLSRHFWRRAWVKRARPLDHGLKMTGAYFAMLSAGVGNIFRDLQPWSQVGPSLLGFGVIIWLWIAYLIRRDRPVRPPPEFV